MAEPQKLGIVWKKLLLCPQNISVFYSLDSTQITFAEEVDLYLRSVDQVNLIQMVSYYFQVHLLSTSNK